MSIRRALAVAVVAICIGVPVVESLDSWDRSLQSDTETNALVAALCVGIALTTATIALAPLRTFLVRSRFDLTPTVSQDRFPGPCRSIPVPTSGPPTTALRI